MGWIGGSNGDALDLKVSFQVFMKRKRVLNPFGHVFLLYGMHVILIYIPSYLHTYIHTYLDTCIVCMVTLETKAMYLHSGILLITGGYHGFILHDYGSCTSPVIDTPITSLIPQRVHKLSQVGSHA